MGMDETKKTTKYFINIVDVPEEPDNQDIDLDQLLEEHPDLRRLAAILLMADKKRRH